MNPRSLAQGADHSLELGSAEPVEIRTDIAQAKDTQLELFRQLTVERRTLAIPAEGELCHETINLYRSSERNCKWGYLDETVDLP